MSFESWFHDPPVGVAARPPIFSFRLLCSEVLGLLCSCVDGFVQLCGWCWVLVADANVIQKYCCGSGE